MALPSCVHDPRAAASLTGSASLRAAAALTGSASLLDAATLTGSASLRDAIECFTVTLTVVQQLLVTLSGVEIVTLAGDNIVTET